MKSFPPDLDSGPLAFLTVSNEDDGAGGQGKNPALIPQSLLDPKLAGVRETGNLNKTDVKGICLVELYLKNILRFRKLSKGTVDENVKEILAKLLLNTFMVFNFTFDIL